MARHLIGGVAAMALAAAWAGPATAAPLAPVPPLLGEGEEMGGPPPAPAAKTPAAPDAAPKPVREDVLVLKDGRELRGKITAEDAEAYAIRVAGTVRAVDKKDVVEVRRAPADAPGEAGADAADRPGGEPAGKGDRKKMRRPEPPQGKAPEPKPLSPEARAWAETCVQRLADADPAIQRSAAEALRALGPAAAPLVEKALADAAPERRPLYERVLGALRAPMQQPGKPPREPGPPGGKPDPTRMFGDRLRTEAGLDDDQILRVGPALADMTRALREASRDLREGVITIEEAQAEREKIREKLRKDLEAATLTAEQAARVDAIVEDSLKKFANRPGDPPGKKPAPPPEKPEGKKAPEGPKEGDAPKPADPPK